MEARGVGAAALVRPPPDGDRRGRATAGRTAPTRPGARRTARSSASRASTSRPRARATSPGEPADLRIATDAAALRVQVFHYGAARPRRRRPAHERRRGDAAGASSTGAPTATRPATSASSAPATGRAASTSSASAPTTAGPATRRSSSGRGGSAPSASPSSSRRTRGRPTTSRTRTGTAGATRGTSSDRFHSVDLGRPYLDFGVPFRFKDWDLALRRVAEPDGQARRLPLRRRPRGGRLGRRAAPRVRPRRLPRARGVRHDPRVRRRRALPRPRREPALPRRQQLLLAASGATASASCASSSGARLGRDEARLVGVRYVGSDQGQRQAPYTVVGAAAAPWLFDGTGLRDGDTFGRYGIEIDARSAALAARDDRARASRT